MFMCATEVCQQINKANSIFTPPCHKLQAPPSHPTTITFFHTNINHHSHLQTQTQIKAPPPSFLHHLCVPHLPPATELAIYEPPTSWPSEGHSLSTSFLSHPNHKPLHLLPLEIPINTYPSHSSLLNQTHLNSKFYLNPSNQ